MRLSCPANYDSSILKELASNSVFEIYGRLNDDVVGGGRPSYMASPISKRRLSNYIQDVRSAGINFNYLLNASCLGNREWTKSFQRQFRTLVDWCVDEGVNTFTITAPYLVEILKARHPQVRIKVGIYAQVDTVKRAEYWDQLGVDAINLESFSMNRDFAKLQAIRAAVKADLVLIANHFCQPNCPYQLQHQNGHSHASGSHRSFYIDYPILQCQKARLSDPKLFVSAGWIRPEDISAYEAIGYQTFKLLERNIPSEDLLVRARAYHARKYEGNLANILLSWGFKEKPPKFSLTWLARSFKPWKLSLSKMREIMNFMKSQAMLFPTTQAPAVNIDSAAIPTNFIEHFKGASCLDKSCKDCGYCQRIASRAVRIDEAFLRKTLPNYQSLHDELVSGKVWGLESQRK